MSSSPHINPSPQKSWRVCAVFLCHCHTCPVFVCRHIGISVFITGSPIIGGSSKWNFADTMWMVGYLVQVSFITAPVANYLGITPGWLKWHFQHCQRFVLLPTSACCMPTIIRGRDIIFSAEVGWVRFIFCKRVASPSLPEIIWTLLIGKRKNQSEWFWTIKTWPLNEQCVWLTFSA